jgi:hypothetical protein
VERGAGNSLHALEVGFRGDIPECRPGSAGDDFCKNF